MILSNIKRNPFLTHFWGLSRLALIVIECLHTNETKGTLILKTIGNKKVIVREVVRGDKHNLRKSANRNAQISVIHSAHCTELCFAIWNIL